MTKKTSPKQVSVRLIPAVMVTVAAVLGLKAVAIQFFIGLPANGLCHFYLSHST